MLILDLMFSHRNICPGVENLRREFDRTAIIIVSMADDSSTIQTLLSYGINGFVHKSVGAQELGDALLAVRQGDVVMRLPAADTINKESPIRLSERQTDVLRLVAEGRATRRLRMCSPSRPLQCGSTFLPCCAPWESRRARPAVTKGISEGLLDIAS